MRIIFMGTPDFAVPSLEILIKNGYNVIAVITSPDHLGGRGGKQLLESPVKKYAIEHNIKVLQPEKFRDKEFLENLKSLNADLQVVVAFRMLPEVVWNMPPLGTINLHGSLLPKYRGAAPINWAVINGEKETGVTTFKLQHDIDTGDIIYQSKMEIGPNENASSVHDRMMMIGANLILKTVSDIQTGNVKFQKQIDSDSSHAPKIFHETCIIDFNQSSERIHNFIRGLSRYPGAHTFIDGKEVKIFEAIPIKQDVSVPFGHILTDNKKTLRITCKDGVIEILSLKMEGKKLMKTQEFLNGYIIQNNKVVSN